MQASLCHSIIPYREPLQLVGSTVVRGNVESLEGLYRWALQIWHSLFRGSISTLISGKIKLPLTEGYVKVKLEFIRWGLVLCSPVGVRNTVCVSSVSSESIQQLYVYIEPLHAQRNIHSRSLNGSCMVFFLFPGSTQTSSLVQWVKVIYSCIGLF